MVAIKHKKVTAIADDPAYDVSADEWNDAHAKGDIADALNTFTLAQLNTQVSDATLDDTSGTRTPTVHAASHQNTGADEVNVAGLSGELADDQPSKAHDLGGAKHNADTLANLNLKVSDATLLDTGDIQYKTGALHAAADHQNAGALEIRLDDFKATEDNTDLNVSTTAHGLCPKLDNVATNYLNGQGGWSAPSGGGISQIETVDGTTDISTTSTTMADISQMTITLTTGANAVLILFSMCVASVYGKAVPEVRLLIDGSVVGPGSTGEGRRALGGDQSSGVYEADWNLAFHYVTTLTAAEHTIKVQWRNRLAGHTTYNRPASGYEHRVLTVIEF